MATTSFFMLFDRNGRPILPGTGAFRRPDWVELIGYGMDVGQQNAWKHHETTFQLTVNDGDHSPILQRFAIEGRHAATGTLMTLQDDGQAYMRYVLFNPLPVSLQGNRNAAGSSADVQTLTMESRHYSITYRSPEGAVTQRTIRASE